MQRKPKTVNRRTSFGHPSIQKGSAMKPAKLINPCSTGSRKPGELGSQKTADRIAVATATCDPQGGEGQKGGVGKGSAAASHGKIAFGPRPVLPYTPTRARAIDFSFSFLSRPPPVVVLTRARAATALLPSPSALSSSHSLLGATNKPCSRCAVLQSQRDRRARTEAR